MSIPNEALQKLLQEIEAKAAFSQQQIGIVRTQMAVKQRESRMLELTQKELTGLPEDTHIYEGVGKMFVMSPSSEVKKRQASEKDRLKTEMEGLQKKLTYLETTFKNSRENLEKLFASTSVS